MKTNECRREEDKKIMGQALVDEVSKRNSGSALEGESENSSENGASPSSGKSKKRRLNPHSSGGERNTFGVQLKEADLLRIALETHRLSFEKELGKKDRR